MPIQAQPFLSKPTVWTIIAANLVPLLGVIFQGWDALDIAFLYWAETVIIGVIQVIRLIITRNMVTPEYEALLSEEDREKAIRDFQESGRGGQIFLRIFLPAFFVVHFGFFIFLQGSMLFLVALEKFMGGDAPNNIGEVIDFFMQKENIQIGLASLALGHLLRFLHHQIIEQGFARDSLLLEMIDPYRRVFIQQIVVIFGTPLMLVFGAPTYLLALLVILKTGFDVRVFLAQDRFFWLRQKKK